jgi:hypothetical protein
MNDSPTSNPSNEVHYACGHTVAHEEDCPRCGYYERPPVTHRASNLLKEAGLCEPDLTRDF